MRRATLADVQSRRRRRIAGAQWETVGWISGGVAAVAIGVGVFSHARGTEQPASASVLRPTVGTVNGLVWEGRF